MTVPASVTSRDAQGRFVTAALAALWADTCDTCDVRLDEHVALRPATGQPFCPTDAVTLETLPRDEALRRHVSGEGLDGTSFVPCDPAACTSPATHAVGCDDGLGF